MAGMAGPATRTAAARVAAAAFLASPKKHTAPWALEALAAVALALMPVLTLEESIAWMMKSGWGLFSSAREERGRILT